MQYEIICKKNSNFIIFLHVINLDLNECDNGVANCDKMNGTCINIPGSYNCKCNDGYEPKDSGGSTCYGL